MQSGHTVCRFSTSACSLPLITAPWRSTRLTTAVLMRVHVSEARVRYMVHRRSQRRSSVDIPPLLCLSEAGRAVYTHDAHPQWPGITARLGARLESCGVLGVDGYPALLERLSHSTVKYQAVGQCARPCLGVRGCIELVALPSAACHVAESPIRPLRSWESKHLPASRIRSLHLYLRSMCAPDVLRTP